VRKLAIWPAGKTDSTGPAPAAALAPLCSSLSRLADAGRIVEAAPHVGNDKPARARLAHDEADLARAIDRHDRHHRQPKLERGEIGEQRILPGGQHDREAVARAQAERVKSRGEAVGVRKSLRDRSFGWPDPRMENGARIAMGAGGMREGVGQADVVIDALVPPEAATRLAILDDAAVRHNPPMPRHEI